MTHRRHNRYLPLPPEFAAQLWGLCWPVAQRSPALGAVVAAAHERGWTFQALADALAVTRQRAHQLAEAADDSPLPIEIPAPPPPPVQVKAVPPPPPRLTPEQAVELRAVFERAQPRGCMPADHPAYEASRRLCVLLVGYRRGGHRLTDLAQVLGVGSPALAARLNRYHGTLPPSMRPKTASKLRAVSDAS